MEIVKHSAPCPKCGQAVLVDAPEGADDEELQALALQMCDCDAAKFQRQADQRMQRVGEWAEKEFGEDNQRLSVILCAIRAVSTYAFDKITIKSGKHTYTMDLDKDGIIRIKDKYADTRENKF